MSPAEWVGLIAGIVMPFWNIPLIVRIVKRRSSADISLTWVVGVWICVVAMVPSSLKSQDLAYKVFGVVNSVFFSGVLAAVLKFHPALTSRKKEPPQS